MNTYDFKLLMLLSFLIVSGCVSLGPKFERLQMAPKDKALIYVYRPSALTGSIQSPDIKFDGKKWARRIMVVFSFLKLTRV